MDLRSYLKEIEKFLVDYLEKTHCKKYVLGLSGGVDSSLVAAIIRKALGKDKLIGVMMPIHSLSKDLEDAEILAKELDINYKVIDASKAYDEFVNVIGPIKVMTSSNLKARMRMSILYAIAQEEGALVVGTDNKDESYTGYFTKYGDGGVDLLPIVHLTKAEVVEAARIYGVNERLATRVPSAGLFEGQTDENEMGVTYKDIDDFLLGKQIPAESLAKINHLHEISEHKRQPIPSPIDFIRD